MTKAQMIYRIDQVADTIRNIVVGDPLRAFEYKQAEVDAKQFKSSNYQGVVPKSIEVWADASGITNEEATDTIIYEADRFNTIMLTLRGYRLKGKSAVRNANTDEIAKVEFDACISMIKTLIQG